MQVIDNPMVLGEYYTDHKPDYTCPNCEKKYYNLYNDKPWSANKVFCLHCIEEMAISETALLTYYDEQFHEEVALLDYLLQTKTKFVRYAAAAILRQYRQQDKEGFALALFEYIKEHCHEEYTRWLMDTY
jgi:hypothetical protein